MLINISYSQIGTPILTLPKDANGYLILDKKSYPNVVYWDVSISNFNDNNEVIVVYNKTFTRNAYDFINPDIYDPNTAILTVKGYDSKDEIIVDYTNSINGEPSEFQCQWICNGPDYVFAVDSWYNPNPGGGYRYSIGNPRTAPLGFDRYYEWFRLVDFNHPVFGPQNPQAHGLTDFNIDPFSLNVTEGKIITYTIPAGVTVRNRYGDVLSGTVRGVQKYFGANSDLLSVCISNPLASSGCSDGSSNLTNVIDLINQNTNNPTIVNCDARITFSGPASANIKFPPRKDCFKTIYQLIAVSTTGMNIVQAVKVPCIDVVSPHPSTLSVQTGELYTWPEDLLNVKFFNMTDPTFIVEIDKSTFFDENDIFIGSPIFMSNGFYRIQYQFNDGTMLNSYVYNEEDNSSSFMQSDFVSCSIYPVPINENWFKLNLQANQRVKFKYELKNMDGTIIYSERFIVEKNETLDKRIVPLNGLQNGTYVNLLTFEDGSVINFQTVK